MNLDLRYQRLKYLLRQSPSAMAKEITQEAYTALFEEYMASAILEHNSFVLQELNTNRVRQAMDFDYEAGMEALQNSVFVLKPQMLLSDINALIGTIREHQNYIETISRVAAVNFNVLANAFNAIVADWQTRALTDTDMAAKTQAQGHHPELRRTMNDAENLLASCKSLMNRLQGQWDTLSRQATIAQKMHEIGDFMVQTQFQPKSHQNEED